jgi:hypothetical protein
MIRRREYDTIRRDDFSWSRWRRSSRCVTSRDSLNQKETNYWSQFAVTVLEAIRIYVSRKFKPRYSYLELFGSFGAFHTNLFGSFGAAPKGLNLRVTLLVNLSPVTSSGFGLLFIYLEKGINCKGKEARSSRVVLIRQHDI